MPAALAVDWDQIKQAAIAGVPFKKLAEEWDIRDEAGELWTGPIRQRCYRESWPIPRAVMAQAQLRLNEAKTAQNAAKEQMRANGETVTDVTQPRANDVITADLLENGQKSNLLASQIALKSLQLAPESLPVTSLADVKTALSVARIAAGMDREGTQVNIGLGSWGAVAVQTEGESGFREVGPDSESS